MQKEHQIDYHMQLAVADSADGWDKSQQFGMAQAGSVSMAWAYHSARHLRSGEGLCWLWLLFMGQVCLSRILFSLQLGHVILHIIQGHY